MTDQKLGAERNERLAAALRRVGVEEPLESGRSDRVGEIYVMLTYDCNLRCRMCPMWGERGFCHEPDRAAEDIEVAEIARVVGEAAAAYQLRTVTISGGEPMRSPKFAPLIDMLCDSGIKVDVTTNGTLLSDLPADRLRRLNQVNLSLDGPPLVLEQLKRGGVSTLRNALAGMRMVIAAKNDRGRPSLRLLAVITSEGVGHLEEMLDYFAAEGVTFDSLLLQHQMFMDGPTAASHHAALAELHGEPGLAIWNGLVDTPGKVDVERLAVEIERISEKHPRVFVSPELSTEDMHRFYGDGSWVPDHLADYCVSPWANVMLGPEGDMWLCPGFRVGNIRQGSFETIYNGEVARKVRSRIAVEGVFPGCRACWCLDSYRQMSG